MFKNKISILMILVCLFAFFFWIGFKAYNRYFPKITSISYVVSTGDAFKYCNGVDMDNQGYRKTLTHLVTASIAPSHLSQEALINRTIALASGKNNPLIIEFKRNHQQLITLKNQTAYVAHIEGWAGISIFMCHWKPLVEANLLRFPGVKKIVWL